MTDLQAGVRDLISETFGLVPEAVTMAASMQTIAGWDSLGHIGLILALEQRFGVSIAVNRIARLTSLAAICDELASLIETPAEAAEF